MRTWGEFGIVIPAGSYGEIDVTCPRCSPTRKKKHARCLSVNVDKGVWNCAHCGWVGSLAAGQQSQEPAWRKPTYRKPDPPKEQRDIDPVIAWFADRGISKEVVLRNKIFGTKIYMPQTESERSVIAFPYLRNGEIINYKYRTPDKLFRMEAGAERILFGYDDIQDTACIICEGEVDRLSIEEAGAISCVSVPDGAPTPNTNNYASKFTFLDDERLERVREWIIAVDNDPPGIRLEQELVRRLGIEKCRKVTWPQGCTHDSPCKDANDVLMNHGVQELTRCIRDAKPYPVEGVIEVGDLEAKLDALYVSGVLRGLSTGWKSLEPYYTVRAGEWTVVTGIPGSGKSNWVDALAVNLAKQHGWSFAVFSPENFPVENHLSRLIEHYARVPFRDGPTPRMSIEEMHRARDWAKNHFRFILPPDDTDWTLDTIFEKALVLVRRHGINGIIIDPWNELDHSWPSSMTETQYISKTLKQMRQFNRRNFIHTFLVAHPQKLFRNKDGSYPVPGLYDISGSAHWYNKTDNGIVVWRDLSGVSSPSVQVHVKKIKFREIGRIGMVELRYDLATGGYYDIDNTSYPTKPAPVVDEDPPEWWQ
jgi:twinkle protein